MEFLHRILSVHYVEPGSPLVPPQGIFSLLTKLSILETIVIQEEKPVETWLEWIWWLFGWPCMRERVELHLDIGRALTIFMIFLLAVALATNLLLLIPLGMRKLVRCLWAGTRGLISCVMFSCTCVFRWLASSRDPGEKIVETIISGAASYMPESIVPNSPLCERDIPSCQVAIGQITDGIFRAVGCAVRVDVREISKSYLIAPSHVLAAARDHFAISGSKSALLLDLDTVIVGERPSRRERYVLDLDVSAFEITDRECSVAGVSVAKILGRLPPGGTLAAIIGPDGKGSIGPLRPDPQSFGYCVYSGSTVNGFSGAVYTVSNSAAAIHMAGGDRNLGYSLRLAYVTLLAYAYHAESSETFLETQFKDRKRSIWVDETWGHIDNVRIQVNGEYHIVSRDNLKRVVGRDRDLAGWVVHECDDPQGNDRQVVTSGDSLSVTGRPQELTLDAQAITRLLELLSQKKENGQKTGKKQKKNTPGHTAQTASTVSGTTPSTSAATPRQ